MWQPTHVQVTVQRARGLNFKGKNGTNDCFVVISLGKEKFQTSIREKSTDPEWREECELAIPEHGNIAGLSLTVYHRNGLGLDEFLGQIQLPLSEFDVYERPRARWHRLKGKPEKDKKKGEKERGELEAKIAFTVKSGSLADLSKKEKHKSSLTSIKNLGGSLMSLGNKERQSIKSFAKSVSTKMDKIAIKPSKKKKAKEKETKDWDGFPQETNLSLQRAGDADPGVISDSDEDFGFDEEVTVNTRSSSPYSTLSRGSSTLQEVQEEKPLPRRNSTHLTVDDIRAPPKPARLGVVGSVENVHHSDSRSSLNTSQSSSTQDVSRFPEIKALKLEKSHDENDNDPNKKNKRSKGERLKNKFFPGSSSNLNKLGSRERLSEENGRIVEGGNDRLPHPPSRQSKVPQEIHDKFSGKSREDLLEIILSLQLSLEKEAKKSRDLEDYIDDLLLRVMEVTPHILQAPVTPTKKKINVYGNY